MEKIIYIKNNGETFKGTRTILTHKSRFLKKGEKVTFVNNKIVKTSDKDDIKSANKIVDNLVDKLYCADKKTIDTFFDSINNVKTKEDMTKISKKMYSIYKTNIEPNALKSYESNEIVYKKKTVDTEKYENILKENPELINSIVVKKTLMFYFSKKISSKGYKQIVQLEIMKNSGINMEEIANILGIKFSEQSKKNGVYELSKRLLNDIIDNMYTSTETKEKEHLCWKCQNGTAIDCDKVADCFKKTIDLYDFIEEGYQTYNDNALDRFVVKKCKKFKEDTKK